jgi:hypothetical protein
MANDRADELARLYARLEEFSCPYCNTALEESQLVTYETYCATYKSFRCGYAEIDGETKRPCPSDPEFPTLEDYNIQCEKRPHDEPNSRWTCMAFPQTTMAKLLHLGTGYGRTEDEARRWIKSRYDAYARRR